MSIRSENPRDNKAIPNPSLTFEEMLEQAMKNDDGTGGMGMQHSQSQGGNFLKKKERYDPKKALAKGKGTVSQKNINKKRIFGKKTDQDSEEMSQEEVKVEQKSPAKLERRGTFANYLRKSVV